MGFFFRLKSGTVDVDAATGGYLPGDLRRRLALIDEDDCLDLLAGQLQGHGCPDAAGRACNQRYFSLDLHDPSSSS